MSVYAGLIKLPFFVISILFPIFFLLVNLLLSSLLNVLPKMIAKKTLCLFVYCLFVCFFFFFYERQREQEKHKKYGIRCINAHDL